MAYLPAFYRFARPHTIFATSLQVAGLFILAGGLRSASSNAWLSLVIAFASCLAANIYIVGLNQVADIEIDRLNKPYLPLPAGELSLRQAQWIVAVLGGLALLLAASQSVYLLLTVSLALIIGTVYSLPPLHLKGRPVWAALSIAFVRGFVTNVGLFLHFHHQLQPAAPIPWPAVLGLALFFFGFGLVIALYKDIPDLAGDRQFGIRTFTVRLGPERVFRAGRWLLTGFYTGLMVVAWLYLPWPAAGGLVLIHGLLVAWFWRNSRRVDPAEPAAVTRFYMFLWGLFYAEYILLGLYELWRA
jgi:homogentisate phytyltransferase / homogentisate geranylgeranyltransferase